MIYLIIALIFGAPLGYLVLRKIWQRKMHIWLPAYLKSRSTRMRGSADREMHDTTHVMFTFVDHFEPGNGGVDESEMQRRVDAWMSGYPVMANKYVDADGRHPQHTWFYPPHYNLKYLHQISSLCFEGFGDIEMHLHHDNDTPDSLRQKLQECKRLYNLYGALITAEPMPKTVYGFIHGDWALCNSAHGNYCGVNNELNILNETGCFADFTMPSCNETQSRKINSIYYAIDKPGRPKSYDTGTDLEVGKSYSGDLVIFQGPLGINWKRRPYPRIENASITTENPPTPDRIDYWIHCGIGVKKRPEWIFVKVHTHGAIPRDWDAIFGKAAEKMHSYFRDVYNDNSLYKLHYVTAREAYNICKAAEAGRTGDPNLYRDFIIKPYVNTKVLCSGKYKIDRYTNEGFKLQMITDGNEDILLSFNDFSLKKIAGCFSHVEYREDQSSIDLRVGHQKEHLKTIIKLTFNRKLPDNEMLNYLGSSNSQHIYGYSVNSTTGWHFTCHKLQS
jgi:hypothetical protein